jgi:hypothetical protein
MNDYNELYRLNPRKHFGAMVLVGVLFGSIIGYGISVVPMHGQVNAPEIEVRILTLLLLIFMLSSLVIGYRLYVSSRNRIRAITREEQKFARVILALEKISAARSEQSKTVLTYAVGEISRVEFEEKTTQFVQLVLDWTKRAFDELTGDNCSVSIKLLVSPRPSASKSVVPLVQTLLRDSASAHTRWNTDNDKSVYPYTDHSPFFDLLQDDSVVDHFYSNDLIELSSKGSYSNSNLDWRKFYRATSISLIRDSGALHSENILGFLCVDNFLGGFEPRISRSIHIAVSAAIYSALFSSAFVQRNLTQQKKPSRKLKK